MVNINVLLFIIIAYSFFFLPGKFFVKNILPKKDNASLIGLSLVSGVGLYMFISLIGFWIQFSTIVYLLLPLSVYQLMMDIKHIRSWKVKIDWPLILLLLLGTIIMSFYVFFSGTEKSGQLVFYGVNAVDGIYHLSLIQSLIYQFPPQHLALSGEMIRGYNFLYDLFIASLVKIFHLNLFDTFFRYSPVFIAFLFGLTGYSLSKALGLSRKASLLLVVFLFLLRGLDWWFNLLFQFVFHQPFAASGVMQSPEQLLDASVATSLVFLFAVVILLFQKRNIYNFIILCILISLIPTIKIYTGVMLFCGVGIVGLYELIRERNWYLTGVTTLSGLLAGLVYFPLNFGAGGLIFSPFLLFRFYIENAPYFQSIQWNVHLRLFLEKQNILRLGYMYTIVGTLFFSSAFGFKLLGLIQLFKRKMWQRQWAALYVAIIAGTIFATFFLQTVAPLVIIQFLWITNVLLIFPFVLFCEKIIPDKYLLLVCVILVLLSLPELMHSLSGFVSPSYVVQKTTMDMVKLSHTVPQSEPILLLGKTDGVTVPIITTLSGHKLYFEQEVMEFSSTRSEIAKRYAFVANLTEMLQICRDRKIVIKNILLVMKNGNLRYLITPINNCLQKDDHLVKVSQEDSALLYTIQ